MEKLIEELKQENTEILKRNPKVGIEFDWSSDAYRLSYNEEMIKKLTVIQSSLQLKESTKPSFEDWAKKEGYTTNNDTEYYYRMYYVYSKEELLKEYNTFKDNL